MSDFVPRETLPDLWEEILQTHWTFLETEESIQKLEERKKLEGCLKEFLCIVPHDRKFFLPETAHVLKKSVKEMNDFSAYKAMLGFESISQYANNLFTKPWRKEYRVIKMYSGFYQHEIKSNLVDADKLFEAMGYKQFPNQILMLDGPICPDQVTNVSRDAMAAYVECQIMKNIFSGLTSMQLSCSWIDIYNFREIHIGGITQAVKSIAYVTQERKYRKEKVNSENCYSTIQSSQAIVATPSCPSCSHTFHSQQQQQISNTCSVHHMPAAVPPPPPSSSSSQQPTYTSVCSLHPQQNIFMQQNNVPVPMHHYKSHNFHHTPSQMSHSKSLEHYVDHVIQPSAVLPHRHSFDQPHYDSTAAAMMNYDCLDGGGGGNYQSCNLNTYNHPYNVSGNRYPLPYNISAQLNNQLQSGSGNCVVSMVGHYPPPPPPVINYGSHKISSALEHDPMHGDYNNFNGSNTLYGKNNQKICGYHNMINDKDLINCRHQYNYNSNRNSDQLIDFDERPLPPPPPLLNDCIIQNQLHRNHHSSRNNSLDYNDRLVQRTINQHQQHNLSSHHYDIPRSLKDLNNKNDVDIIAASNDTDDNNYLYSSTSRNEKKSALKRSTDKYIRNAEILEQYQKIIDNNEQKSGGTRDSYDNYEEISGGGGVGDGCGEIGGNMADGSSDSIQQHHQSKPSVINKNQDGVGSFESWDYVFQNLEKHGYNKDLGERGDLLVQGLDLDLMNINGAIDKRRSRNIETKSIRITNESVKTKSIDKKQDSVSKQDQTVLNKQQQQSKAIIMPSSLLKNENVTTTTAETSATTTAMTIGANNKKPVIIQQVPKSNQQQQNQQTQKQKSTIQQNSSKVAINNNNNNNNFNDDQSLRSTLHRLSSNGILVAAHCQTVDTGNTNIGRNGCTDIGTGTGMIGDSKSTLVSTSTSTSRPTTGIISTSTPIVTVSCGPNEWSCRFCTYLNPETRRICEMCCRSRDFILDTTNAPTCV